jgi:O-antigen/teichoic acid export membrane protein
MSKNKLFSDISISAVQVAFNQLSSILIFFIVSTHIGKPELGLLNWMIATLLIIFSVLGFGFEHITVRKIATGEDPKRVLQTYLFHVLLCGIFCGILVLLLRPAVPLLREKGNWFLWLLAGQFVSFVSTPFRQIMNGMERYQLLFIMSSLANLVKVASLLIFLFLGNLSVELIVKIYFMASLAELFASLFIHIVFLRMPVTVSMHWQRYTKAIKETLPALGVIILSTALARMDWVLLGIMTTASVVADYSVANRVFELSTLPLLALAPVLFPKIARYLEYIQHEGRTDANSYLRILVRIEIIVAVFIAMMTNLCWEDTVNLFTGNKYGSSGRMIFLIMSFAMPLLYLNNIFWSVLFARKKMRTIFLVFLVTFLVNAVTDLITIPYFGATGAAAGYVLALVLQISMYFRVTELEAGVKRQMFLLVPVCIIAWIVGWFCYNFIDILPLRMLIACLGYFFLLIVTGILKPEHWQVTKRLLSPVKA